MGLRILSLNQWLRCMIVGVPVGLLLLVLYIVSSTSNEAFRIQARRNMETEIKSLADQVEKHFDHAAQIASSIGAFQKRRGKEPTAEMMDHLRVLLESLPRDEVQGVYMAFEHLHHEHPNANQWYDWKFLGKKETLGYNFHDCTQPGREWYCHAKAITDETSYNVTEPYFDTGGAEMELVSITRPVRIGNEFVGVAGVDMAITQLGGIVNSLNRKGEYTCLVSKGRAGQGPVVFAMPDAQFLEFGGTKEGGFPSVDKLPGSQLISSDVGGVLQAVPGSHRLVSWRQLKGTDWKVVRSVPEESVYGQARRIFYQTLLVGFSGLIAMAAITVWFVERALGPIPTLSAAAAAVERGDYRAEGLTEIAQRGDEMGQLARGFCSMVNVVSEREASLIRAKQELAGSEKRFRALIENSSDLITIVNSSIVSYRSPSIRNILGYEPEETVGANAIDLIHPDDRPRILDITTRSPGEIPEKGSIEYRFLHKEGTWRTVEGKYTDLRHDPEIRGIVFNSRDITDRKMDEIQIRGLAADLARERDKLEERVRVRTAELEQKNEELIAAKEAAELAMKQKDEFLDNVAHDLRTPLTVVIGFSEDLLEQAQEDGLTDYATDLKRVANRSHDLLELVNDLLSMSKARNDKGIHLDLEEFDVAAVIQDRLEGIGAIASKQRNHVRFEASEGLGTMVADKVKVWRILMNLLSNACKFTRHGSIVISASRTNLGGADQIVFRVTDTGLGMSPAQLARLFKRFSQVQGTTAERQGGVGLGLSICRLYCDAMGGRIEVESTEGSGSTFIVTLPAVVGSAADDNSAPPTSSKAPVFHQESASATRSAPSPAAPENLVLIIDDDPSVCELMRRNLGQEGFQIRTATSGTEGIELARHLQPSAIILDVLMPGDDGWAVLSTLKADPETANIPIIMASILDERERGFSMGADEYLVKPLPRGQLVKILHKHTDSKPTGNLLVVEDDVDVRERLCRSLREQGWTVTESGDGADALSRIREQRPDLMILDLMLPKVNGFDVLEELQKDSDLQRIPVIVVTGASLEREEEARLQQGAERVLQKGSFDQSKLLRTINALVRAHQTSFDS